MMPAKPDRQNYLLIGLIFVQSVCAVFFLADVVRDIIALGAAYFTDWHVSVEFLAAIALLIGIGLEARLLIQLLRRQAHSERALGIASGALHDLMEQYFETWGLTPAEADVAAFTLKGMVIAEIAALRGSREGTIKTHLNAIYRKAGVTGRGPLVCLLIEDLMAQPLVADGAIEKGDSLPNQVSADGKP